MPSFQRILVAVDTEQPAHPELEQALHLAQLSRGQVFIVDNLRDLHASIRFLAPEWHAKLEELATEKQTALECLTDQARQTGVIASNQLLRGSYSQALLELIQQQGIDLVIRSAKGSRSRELGSLGATSRQLLQTAPCAVWLTQGPRAGRCQRILAAIDATPDDIVHAELNRSILNQARELANSTKGELHVLYVWNLFGTALLESRMSPGEFDELVAQNEVFHQTNLDKSLGEFGMSCRDNNVHLQRGEPEHLIPEFCESREIDLLVCGTVARRGLSNLMIGNTVVRLLSRLTCSVLALKPAALTDSTQHES